jgi:hypothetical protein
MTARVRETHASGVHAALVSQPQSFLLLSPESLRAGFGASMLTSQAQPNQQSRQNESLPAAAGSLFTAK